MKEAPALRAEMLRATVDRAARVDYGTAVLQFRRAFDAVDGAGASALHLAVDVYSDALEQEGENPGTATCELLIELGLDPGMRDREGRTARDWAKEAGALALEKLLEYE